MSPSSSARAEEDGKRLRNGIPPTPDRISRLVASTAVSERREANGSDEDRRIGKVLEKDSTNETAQHRRNERLNKRIAK
jgi:hypothetical protein